MVPLIPDISEDRFIEADWYNFYRDAKEDGYNLPQLKMVLITMNIF